MNYYPPPVSTFIEYVIKAGLSESEAQDEWEAYVDDMEKMKKEGLNEVF